jgi:acyl-CoA synthetase (AMP-forming)/AMP-acid ligase II
VKGEESQAINMRQLTIGEIVARNARKTPDREAVIFEGRTYSYRDFDERTNQLGNILLSRYEKASWWRATLRPRRWEG